MRFPSFSVVLVILILQSVLSVSEASQPILSDFIQCLAHQTDNNHSSPPIFTPSNSTTFEASLLAYAKNKRYVTPATPKPWAIVPVATESHVQSTVLCAKNHGFQIRIRSGGHDYEALSYVSDDPFVILDMFNLRSIQVNLADESAWVESGATVGEIYAAIANKSNVHGFPAGVCHTIGAGGHFSGGGYGYMMRKYGITSDNIVDAKLVNVKGEILDRVTMGEDMFWAIRGGGGGSFGVVLSWKIKLVRVPEKVTVFNIKRTLGQNGTDVIYKWQFVAPKFPSEIFIRAMPQVITTAEGNKTLEFLYIGLLLGTADEFLPLINEKFPELGLQQTDCMEMSWINSTLIAAGFSIGSPVSALLDRPNNVPDTFFKSKSDYVTEPISKASLETIWRKMMIIGNIWMQWNPYGGRMSEIAETETPFPHRGGVLFLVQEYTYWQNETETDKYLDFSRRFYGALAPFVSSNPRESFLNYRDLDIGTNLINQTQEAVGFGPKYFKNNYDRLVRVKTRVDPGNFFRHEQSIPPL